MSNPKILRSHLQRNAVIYIRQSSPTQVEQNLESQKRQYQLTERAQHLGWLPAQCVVIDDDLGVSGAQSHNRPGYQRLISMRALREVGLVLGLEVSRLARNSLDWYQLLELASAFEVLIADEDGLYDPRDFNDRLLLGLKGTISEVELHQIRARMTRGRLNKAARGELETPLPIGLERDPLTGQIILATDQGVRHAIERVFTLYRQLGTIRAVLRQLRLAGLELPFQQVHPLGGVEIKWRAASYDAIYALITNPAYAGVYSYGKRQRSYDPLSRTYHTRQQARADWMVFLPTHHSGYLTLEEYEENQQTLASHRMSFPAHTGAARNGATLLQGLIYCQHCGQKMRVRYHRGVAYYTCDSAHQHYDAPVCNRARAQRVDALVGELFLSVLNEGTLAQSLLLEQELQKEQAVQERDGREQLQRLEYQADLAHRRYALVDPANRLVAQTLETQWEERLRAVETARQAYEKRVQKRRPLSATRAEMQFVIEHLREFWHGDKLAQADKKELVRCVIERVFVQKEEKLIRAQVHWYGGARSELEVPKYLASVPHLFHRISTLARTQTDAEIAATLNQEGVRTAKNKEWTARHVMDFRRTNEIPSGFTQTPELRITENGYLRSAEAAARFGVNQQTIQRWYRLGILSGKHLSGQAHLWIFVDEEVERRLNGSARPDARMVSTKRLSQEQGKQLPELIAQAQRNGDQIYRLRRGNRQCFYLLPAATQTNVERNESDQLALVSTEAE